MKRKTPTKKQLHAARAGFRKGRALVRKARKVFSKTRRPHAFPRPPSNAQRAFYVWQHDLETLMSAVVRTPGSDSWSPAEIAKQATRAADHMKEEVASRRYTAFRSGRRRLPARGWRRWQSVFDQFVHDLAERTDLDAGHVIDRAVALADAMIKVADRRRRAFKAKRAETPR